MQLTPQPGFPPNIEAIRERFGPLPPGVVFCWSPVLYTGEETKPIPVDLYAHEMTHVTQQEEFGGPARWWERYLADDDFRLEQEIEAYREQYRVLKRMIKDRNDLVRAGHFLAVHMASPIYGNIIDVTQAYKRITA